MGLFTIQKKICLNCGFIEEEKYFYMRDVMGLTMADSTEWLCPQCNSDKVRKYEDGLEKVVSQMIKEGYSG